MEIHFINRYLMFILIININVTPLFTKAQSISKNEVLFKILNYKKIYRESDTIILSIENITAKSLYFVVGEEIPDRYGWIEFHLDIKNDVYEDLPPRYELLFPHKTKIINFRYSEISKKHIEPHGKPHGKSDEIRFFLSYFSKNDSNDLIPTKKQKILSKKFYYCW